MDRSDLLARLRDADEFHPLFGEALEALSTLQRRLEDVELILSEYRKALEVCEADCQAWRERLQHNARDGSSQKIPSPQDREGS